MCFVVSDRLLNNSELVYEQWEVTTEETPFVPIATVTTHMERANTAHVIRHLTQQSATSAAATQHQQQGGGGVQEESGSKEDREEEEEAGGDEEEADQANSLNSNLVLLASNASRGVCAVVWPHHLGQEEEHMFACDMLDVDEEPEAEDEEPEAEDEEESAFQ